MRNPLCSLGWWPNEATLHHSVHHLKLLIIANNRDEAWAVQFLTGPYFKHAMYVSTALLLI